MTEENLLFQLYQTNNGESINANARLIFHEHAGGLYEGTVTMDVPANIQNLALHGKAVGNEIGLTIIQFIPAAAGNHRVKFTLIKNPYETRVSYAGAAMINEEWIYSMTAIMTHDETELT